MDFVFDIATLAGGLFAGMLVLLETGRRLGLRRLARDSEAARAGFGVVGGAIFALMGLLIAFTFSGAASRFDTRRQLVVEEANAIGTAYLRLDLLPANAQSALRESFRQYVEARLDVYRKLPDIVAAKQALAQRHPATGADLEPGACRLPGGPPTCDHAAAAGVERDDRHYDHPERGDPNPPTAGDLRHALCAGAGELTAGGI